MSKPIDYSKFDHIDDDDSDEEAHAATRSKPAVAPVMPALQSTGPSMHKDQTTGRFVFKFNGREVYQWDQTLDDVTIYVTAPPHVTKGNQIAVQILPTHLRLGLVGGTQWFLDEPTFGMVDVSESTWSLEDGNVITIYLTKAHRGELWDAALKGNKAVQLDPMSKEDEKKKLMLERFQEENPGFDFRDAQFNGGVPDPRSFMGGVKYS